MRLAWVNRCNSRWADYATYMRDYAHMRLPVIETDDISRSREYIDELGYTNHDSVEISHCAHADASWVWRLTLTLRPFDTCLKVAYFSRATFERQIRDRHDIDSDTRLSYSQEVTKNKILKRVSVLSAADYIELKCIKCYDERDERKFFKRRSCTLIWYFLRYFV